MPREKIQLKYKCLELLCNTVHRKDKWLKHCKEKHAHKYKNNLKINYKVIEIKTGDGPWRKYATTDTTETAHQQLSDEIEESR